jgi:metal-responsive CopG/Arc/MetJ family transcriptional regulator
MAGVAKIAISLDAELLRRVERVRGLTGESRSAVVGRALRLLTEEGRRVELIEQYQRSYRDLPERPDEISTARRLARRSVASLPWSEE